MLHVKLIDIFLYRLEPFDNYGERSKGNMSIPFCFLRTGGLHLVTFGQLSHVTLQTNSIIHM